MLKMREKLFSMSSFCFSLSIYSAYNCSHQTASGYVVTTVPFCISIGISNCTLTRLLASALATVTFVIVTASVFPNCGLMTDRSARQLYSAGDLRKVGTKYACLEPSKKATPRHRIRIRLRQPPNSVKNFLQPLKVSCTGKANKSNDFIECVT